MEGLIWFGKIKENWICKQTQPILIMSFLKHKWINWSTIWFEPCHRTQMVYTFRTIMLIIVIMIIIIVIIIIVVIIMTNMIIMILFPTKACGALVTQTTLLPAASSLERRFPIVAIYFSHCCHILFSLLSYTFPIDIIYYFHCCNILFPLLSYTFPIDAIYFSHWRHILIPLLSYTFFIVVIYFSHCCHALFLLLQYTWCDKSSCRYYHSKCNSGLSEAWYNLFTKPPQRRSLFLQKVSKQYNLLIPPSQHRGRPCWNWST